jgi:hypothetical protein
MMKTDPSNQESTGVSTVQRLAWLLLPKPGERRRAFTRVELVVLLGSLALFLACVALPALANNRQGSERARCVNNLRQIGQGFQLYGLDNDQLNPWWIIMPGGTKNHPFHNSLYVHYAWISNHLATPKVLACPADREARAARDWSTSPDYGFLNASLQNRSISYFIGLHSFHDYPQSILAGDRNLRVDQASGTCSSGIPNPAAINPPYDRPTWADLIHGETGNLLLTSGSVLQLPNSGLRPALTSSAFPFVYIHLMFPGTPYQALP